MPKKNKLNARRRCASISLSLLHTQGVKTLTNQKMQNEPNYPYRWHLAGFPIPKNTKRTLKITQAAGLPPLYLTLTEVGDTPNSQKMRNEPNLLSRHPPILPNAQNEPNLPHPHRPANPKMRNEPNSPLPQPGPRAKYAKRTQSRPAGCPKYAKRTQFPRTRCPTAPCFSETNPIPTPHCHPERRAAERSAAAQSRETCQISIAAGDSEQTNPARPTAPPLCETNPIPYRWRLAGFSSPKYAKRTQLPPKAIPHQLPAPTPTKLRETNPIPNCRLFTKY